MLFYIEALHKGDLETSTPPPPSERIIFMRPAMVGVLLASLKAPVLTNHNPEWKWLHRKQSTSVCPQPGF